MRQSWRRSVYDLIESEEPSLFSKLYEGVMLVCIVASLIPLAFRVQNTYFVLMDKISVSIFILDYLFRWTNSGCRIA